MQRDNTSQNFPLGTQLPDFSLPSTQGESVGSDYLRGSKASLVAFICNHCPYVKGSEQHFIDIVREFQPLGLKVVAISSNDSVQYPEDSFENMREKSARQELPFPYLYDESQSVARLFDAACTPEFYLFDRDGKLQYQGAINDSPRDAAKVTRDYLSQAIRDVLEGKLPNPQFVNPLGCSIKWKPAR